MERFDDEGSTGSTDVNRTDRSSHRRAVIQASFVVFLWATSFVLIKIELERIPALTFAGLRYALAFACLLIPTILSGKLSELHRLSQERWRQILLLGLLLYAVTQGASFLALSYLPAVTVTLLWSFSSVSVALMGIVWLAERPTGFQWLGVGLATVGAVIYFYPARMPEGRGTGLVVAAAGVLANGAAAVLGRKINRRADISPLVVTVISMGFGAAVLLATGIGAQGFPIIGVRSWVIIAWLAAVNTAFAFTLWNHTLRTLSATESSVINGTMQIWIPILSVIFLGERLSVVGTVGLVLTAAGTLVVQLRNPGAVDRLLERRLDGGE
ncbi:MAG: DMT family transporter [Anaerolineae bacterium]